MKKEILNLGVVLQRAELQKVNGGGNASCSDGSTIYGGALEATYGSSFTCYNGIGCFQDDGDVEFLCESDLEVDPEHLI
jgi:hypothetical protein